MRPPSRKRLVMSRRPRSASAERVGCRRRRGSRRRPRAGRRRGRRRPPGRRRRGPATGRGSRAAASRAEGGPGESKTTRSGWRAPSTSRAVSSGSSARTVPMPTAIASDSARQRWTRARLCSPEIQGESPGGGRGAAVERHRQLQGDQRQAGAGVLAEGLVEQARGGRLLAGRELDLDPAVAEDPGPAPGGLLARVVGGDHDPRRSPPRGSPRRRAAGAPGARRARASRTSSPRPGPRRAPRQSRAPPARRAGRPARRGTPRRSPRRPATITAPTSGFGLTRPRPPSASSSARRRCARSVPVSWAFID